MQINLEESSTTRYCDHAAKITHVKSCSVQFSAAFERDNLGIKLVSMKWLVSVYLKNQSFFNAKKIRRMFHDTLLGSRSEKDYI